MTQGSGEGIAVKGDVSLPVRDAMPGTKEGARSLQQEELRSAEAEESDTEDKEGEPGTQPSKVRVCICIHAVCLRRDSIFSSMYVGDRLCVGGTLRAQ